MKPRISVITLGVAELATSLRFYRDGLGFPVESATPEIVFFRLDGSWLALYDRERLAEEVRVSSEGTGFPGFTLAHNVAAREEVDAVLAEAVRAGGTLVKPA